MAIVIPILGYALGAAAGAGTTALAVGFVGAAVATYGIAMENKDATLIGSLIGLGAGALAGAGAAEAGTAAAEGAAETSTTQAMAEATAAGADPTTAAGTGLAAEEAVQVIPYNDPNVGITQGGIAGENIAADVGGIGASPGQALARPAGIIEGQDWSQSPRFGGSNAPTDVSSLGGSPQRGLLESVLDWGKNNQVLGSSLINVGGKFIEKGFGSDPAMEKVKLEKQRQEIELDLLNQKLARQNYIPGMPFKPNQGANLYPGGQIGVPQPVGLINRAAR